MDVSLKKWEELRVNEDSKIEPRQNGQVLDVLRSPNNEDSSLAFCHIVPMYPLTKQRNFVHGRNEDEDGDGEEKESDGNEEEDNDDDDDSSNNYFAWGFEYAIATELALYHLNEGIGTFVKEVEGLNNRCDIRFTSKYLDTNFEQGPAMKKVVNEVNAVAATDTATDNNNNNNGTIPMQRLPSGFLGCDRSAISGPTSIVTGLGGYPQLSGSSTSTALDNKDTYPKFGRTIPSDDAVAEIVVQYFRDVLQLEHVAIINVNDSYGNNYVNGLISSAKRIHPTLKILQIPVERELSSIQQAISTLKQSQYLVAFCIIFEPEWHDNLMLEAYKQGVAGGDDGQHNWFYGDAFNDVLTGREFEKDSMLYSAYKGTGMIAASATIGDKYDLFERTLQSFKPLAATSNSNSSSTTTTTELWDYFGSKIPHFDNFIEDTSLSLFMNSVDGFTLFYYDAAILMGLAACDAVSKNNDTDTLHLTGDNFFNSILNYPNVIDGVTGNIKIDPKTGSRLPSSTFFTIINFPIEVERYDEDTGKIMVSFPRVTSGEYIDGSWKSITPYVFNDGTTNTPKGIPIPTVEQNLVHPWVRVVTLMMFVFAILLSVGFAVWSYVFRETRVVKASQPFFLYLICLGCFIMTSSIITFQIDEQVTAMDDNLNGCSIACNAMIWQVYIGFAVVFSSIFTKTRRVNKVMQSSKKFSRIKLTVSDTIRPVIILTTLNVIILALMSGFHPLSYTIETVKVDQFGQLEETYGHCVWMDPSAIWYIIVLSLLDLGSVIVSIVEAWKARNLATEFAESQYIFKMLVTILVVISLGGPMLYITKDNPPAMLFVKSGVVFIVVCAVLILMMVPKIIFYYKTKNDKKGSTVRVTIGNLDLTTSRTLPGGNVNRNENNTIDSLGDFNQRIATIRCNNSNSSIGSSEISNDNSDEDENCFGEKILTKKSQYELVKENRILKDLLRKEKERNYNKRKFHTRLANSMGLSHSRNNSVIRSTIPVSSPRSETTEEPV